MRQETTSLLARSVPKMVNGRASHMSHFETRLIELGESPEYVQILAALREFNASHRPRDAKALTLAVYDSEQKLAAGLNGTTSWRWLHIEHLWVREDCRKAGLGKRLL